MLVNWLVPAFPPPEGLHAWATPPPSEPRSTTTVTPVEPEQPAAAAGPAVDVTTPTPAAAVVRTAAARRAIW